MTDGVVFNGSSLINGSTVSIPLKTNADATTFSFILNSGSTNPALVNEDILKFNYAREAFVSERVVLKQNIHSILELRMSLLMLQ
jgi:ribonucleotide monophosphatase NagD (HAD superfamily)